ncbi:MAG: DNA polymerase III subunit gamma/tau, partial [Candidatus Rokubacteria bacterium]|nr:DNA polymerase III subunit gamma/tau [Candidatus Rokubacteria bacterium]
LCTSRDGPEPCGRCGLCQEVQAGTAVDVIEIDGASNRGIDEIRTLRENVRYAPARGRYKVYIIDEVHMLTEPAFNALLKTLEEPPPHVVFVLATTDARRIPLTILSRCQRFDFKPIPPEVLTASLERVLAEEQIAYDRSALPLLVRGAEGSLRDVLSLLDTALAYGGGRLDAAPVARLLGASGPVLVRAFVAAVVSCDAAACLEAVDQAVREGDDLAGLCRDVVEAVRLLLLLKVAPDSVGSRLAPGEVAELDALAERTGVDELLYLLRAFLEAEAEIRRSPNPRVELEIAAVRVTRRPVPAAIEAVLARVEEAEARLRQMAITGSAPSKAQTAQESLFVGEDAAPPTVAPPRPAERPVAPAPVDPPGQAPASDPGEGFEAGWERVVDEVTKTKPTLGTVLQQSTPVALREGQLVLSLMGNHFHADLLGDRNNRELVTEAVQRHIPGATRIEVTTASAPSGPGQEHPLVQTALGIFQGEVVAVKPRNQEGGAIP